MLASYLFGVERPILMEERYIPGSRGQTIQKRRGHTCGVYDDHSLRTVLYRVQRRR